MKSLTGYYFTSYMVSSGECAMVLSSYIHVALQGFKVSLIFNGILNINHSGIIFVMSH